jgi:predicted ferric reductase
MISGTLPWYVARAAGLTAWALLTASVLWGLALSTKALGRKVRPNWLLDLHRYLGGLATVFTGVHVAAIMADSYTHFGLASVLVPLAASWHPVAIAWGVVGLYLLLAVELTSLARSRLSRRLWRATHFASLPLFAFATIHGLSAGTDTGTWGAELAGAAAVVAVAALMARRLATAGFTSRSTGRRHIVPGT